MVFWLLGYHTQTRFITASSSPRLGVRNPQIANPQSWGRGGRRGSGMVPFERALVSSHRPSMVTFHLSLRVSEILPLLCSSSPLFSTPPLVSPQFPHVPVGVDGWPLGYEERRFSANIPRSYFQDFKPCGPDPPTSQTDRQTDRRHTIAIPRFALQCIAR